jgi:hypothetical protein
MSHALMYHGSFESNFSRMKPGATTFLGSDGSEHVLPEWPDEADGLRIGYMEKEGKRFVAVRVMDDESDVILRNELLLHPPSHMGHGKRFAPEPTVIEDDAAKQLLHDIMEKNPEQRAELRAIRDRMPWGRKS